jgi:hypothetical protein
LDQIFCNEDYCEVDMGAIDEEELPFMIIDKDSGKVYDTRNDEHVERLSNVKTSFRTGDDSGNFSQKSGSISLRSSRQSGWGDWWRLKKKNDQDFLWAAESGNLEKVRKYLNKDQMQDMVADVNAKGLHQWSALHFAADLGFF